MKTPGKVPLKGSNCQLLIFETSAVKSRDTLIGK
jgi:hypothetical protein